MKKMLLLTIALVLVMAGVALADSIVGSAHDMRTYFSNGTTQVCVYCHTPHQPANRTADPLWNHTLSTAGSYGKYASATMNAVPTAIDSGDGSVGSLCMSCHDGTVAVTALWKQPADGSVVGSTQNATGNAVMAAAKITSSALLGPDLQNDHPVNFTYDNTLAGLDGGLKIPDSASQVTTGVPLYNGTMQCSSCHNVHDPKYKPFLRLTNDASGQDRKSVV